MRAEPAIAAKPLQPCAEIRPIVYKEERVSRLTGKRKDTVPKKDERRERLAQGLRANLLKRKAQAQARKEEVGEKGRKTPTP
jgi:hypothetical protein